MPTHLDRADAVELRVATALGAREMVVHVEAWD